MERGILKGADSRETKSSRASPSMPWTSLQGPGDPPAVWAALAGDSSEGWTGWGEGQVKDFKRNIPLKRFQGSRKEIGALLSLLPSPRLPFFPGARLENP